MDALINALQQGRLVELPDNDKNDALHFLAHIIEAIPSVPGGTDVQRFVMARERSTNTTLGKGWACPYARVHFEDDLICVVGWSPEGIDYGAPDGIPVSVIVMYLVPENQRNHFLREASMVARALIAYPGLEKVSSAKGLDEIREHLLNLIKSTKESARSDTRARMIQLQSGAGDYAMPVYDLAGFVIVPLTIIADHGHNRVVLAQNHSLVEYPFPAWS